MDNTQLRKATLVLIIVGIPYVPLLLPKNWAESTVMKIAHKSLLVATLMLFSWFWKPAIKSIIMHRANAILTFLMTVGLPLLPEKFYRPVMFVSLLLAGLFQMCISSQDDAPEVIAMWFSTATGFLADSHMSLLGSVTAIFFGTVLFFKGVNSFDRLDQRITGVDQNTLTLHIRKPSASGDCIIVSKFLSTFMHYGSSFIHSDGKVGNYCACEKNGVYHRGYIKDIESNGDLNVLLIDIGERICVNRNNVYRLAPFCSTTAFPPFTTLSAMACLKHGSSPTIQKKCVEQITKILFESPVHDVHEHGTHGDCSLVQVFVEQSRRSRDLAQMLIVDGLARFDQEKCPAHLSHLKKIYLDAEAFAYDHNCGMWDPRLKWKEER